MSLDERKKCGVLNGALRVFESMGTQSNRCGNANVPVLGASKGTLGTLATVVGVLYGVHVRARAFLAADRGGGFGLTGVASWFS